MKMDKAKHFLLTTLGVVCYLSSMLQRIAVSLAHQSLPCHKFLILRKFPTDVQQTLCSQFSHNIFCRSSSDKKSLVTAPNKLIIVSYKQVANVFMYL